MEGAEGSAGAEPEAGGFADTVGTPGPSLVADGGLQDGRGGSAGGAGLPGDAGAGAGAPADGKGAEGEAGGGGGAGAEDRGQGGAGPRPAGNALAYRDKKPTAKATALRKVAALLNDLALPSPTSGAAQAAGFGRPSAVAAAAAAKGAQANVGKLRGPESLTEDGLALLLDFIRRPAVRDRLQPHVGDLGVPARKRKREASANEPEEGQGLAISSYAVRAPTGENKVVKRGLKFVASTGRTAKVHFPAAQQAVLRQAFEQDPRPSKETCAQLAQQLGGVACMKKVSMWFANQRKSRARQERASLEGRSGLRPSAPRVVKRIRDSERKSLETAYQSNPAPDLSAREALATLLGVSTKQVTKWFRRRQETGHAPYSGRSSRSSDAKGGSAAVEPRPDDVASYPGTISVPATHFAAGTASAAPLSSSPYLAVNPSSASPLLGAPSGGAMPLTGIPLALSQIQGAGIPNVLSAVASPSMVIGSQGGAGQPNGGTVGGTLPWTRPFPQWQ